LWPVAPGPFFFFLIEKISLYPPVGIGWNVHVAVLRTKPGAISQRELSVGLFHVFELVSLSFKYKFHSSLILYESGHIMALAAWSLGPVACAMVQDPLDAWSLKLNLRTEFCPGLRHQVEL